MTIEEKVFARKRFATDRMLQFGFRKEGENFLYAEEFMQGDFRAEITVSGKACLRGVVIDCMNDEEYAPLRAESYDGAFVNTVRYEYEKVLMRIASACCKETFFTSDQANRITSLIGERYGVQPDFPWGESPYDNAGTFRHKDTGKWFALIMDVKRKAVDHQNSDELIDVINLKAQPRDPAKPYPLAVYPAYHMNHKMWISVTLDDRISDEEVMSYVDESFSLTKKPKKRKEKDT